jgi:hypothetical protein
VYPLLPDPITDHSRRVSQERYKRRAAYILSCRPGFNLRYWKRIVRVSARVDRLAAHRGWDREVALLFKALLISRMTCLFIDHLVGRLNEAGLVPAHELTPEWERQYAHFLDLFLRLNSVSDGGAILQAMGRLHYYTAPPEWLLRARMRHWGLFGRLAASGKCGGAGCGGRRCGEAVGRRACTAAARAADAAERRGEGPWDRAYADAMLGQAGALLERPDALAAILSAVAP